jgi:AraC-like DNA-binding protein
VPEGTTLAGDGYTVADVRCPGGPAGFDTPEVSRGHLLVAARRGAFLRREGGTEILIDGTVAYLSAPGQAEQYAHPIPGGDVCTGIWLSPSLLAMLTGADPAAAHALLPMDAASEFALRRITALALRGDPDGSLAERVVRFGAALFARGGLPERAVTPRPATTAAWRRTVSQAKAALAADPRLGLIALGRMAGCSPHHLSRVFSQLTGASVSQYRNRLRVSLALDRLAQGERDLAALACDLGFADHAHLTRTVRAATGGTPSALRAALTADSLCQGRTAAPMGRD